MEAIVRNHWVFLNKSIHFSVPIELEKVLAGSVSNSGTMLAVVTKNAPADTSGDAYIYFLSNIKVTRSFVVADAASAEFTFDETRLIVMTKYFQFLIYHTCPVALSRTTSFPCGEELYPKSFVLFQDATRNKFNARVTFGKLPSGEETETWTYNQEGDWNLYEDDEADRLWVQGDDDAARKQSSDDAARKVSSDDAAQPEMETVGEAAEELKQRAMSLKVWADQLYEKHHKLMERTAKMTKVLEDLPDRQRRLRDRVRDLCRRMQCLIEKADVKQHGADIERAWMAYRNARTGIHQIIDDPMNTRMLATQVDEDAVRELMQLHDRIRALAKNIKP